MMTQRISTFSLTGLMLGSGAVLTAGTPDPGQLVRELSAPHRWISLVGPDAAVATLAGAALWLLALWVAVSLVVTAGSLLPGRLGAFAHAVACRLTPAALRRVVVSAAGVSVLLAPATALAAPTAPPAPASAPAAMPAVGWPTGPGSAPTAHPTAPTARPTAPTARTPAPTARTTAPAARTPAPRTPSTPQHRPAPQPATGRLTVRPGDSLWTIAARRLGGRPAAARIQREWPRWFAANRQLIGADPGLILPGTRLVVPRSESTPAGGTEAGA